MKGVLSFPLLILFAAFSAAGQHTLKATKYYPGYRGMGTITASGARVDMDSLKAGSVRWVALSSDMFRRHRFRMGDTIVVESDNSFLDGLWVVKDKMHGRWRRKIDFMLHYSEDIGFDSPIKVRVWQKDDWDKAGQKHAPVLLESLDTLTIYKEETL